MSVAVGKDTDITPERLIAAAKVLREVANEPILGLLDTTYGEGTYFEYTARQLSDLAGHLELVPVTKYRWK